MRHLVSGACGEVTAVHARFRLVTVETLHFGWPIVATWYIDNVETIAPEEFRAWVKKAKA